MGKAKAERRLKDNEAQAVARTIRVSPQKLNLVAAMIRGKKVDRALAELEFSPQAHRRHRQEDPGIGNRKRREQPRSRRRLARSSLRPSSASRSS